MKFVPLSKYRTAQTNENGNVALSGRCFTIDWLEIDGTAIIIPYSGKV